MEKEKELPKDVIQTIKEPVNVFVEIVVNKEAVFVMGMV
jgi:hypothetical protein